MTLENAALILFNKGYTLTKKANALRVERQNGKVTIDEIKPLLWPYDPTRLIFTADFGRVTIIFR